MVEPRPCERTRLQGEGSCNGLILRSPSKARSSKDRHLERPAEQCLALLFATLAHRGDLRGARSTLPLDSIAYVVILFIASYMLQGSPN